MEQPNPLQQQAALQTDAALTAGAALHSESTANREGFSSNPEIAALQHGYNQVNLNLYSADRRLTDLHTQQQQATAQITSLHTQQQQNTAQLTSLMQTVQEIRDRMPRAPDARMDGGEPEEEAADEQPAVPAIMDTMAVHVSAFFSDMAPHAIMERPVEALTAMFQTYMRQVAAQRQPPISEEALSDLWPYFPVTLATKRDELRQQQAAAGAAGAAGAPRGPPQPMQQPSYPPQPMQQLGYQQHQQQYPPQGGVRKYGGGGNRKFGGGGYGNYAGPSTSQGGGYQRGGGRGEYGRGAAPQAQAQQAQTPAGARPQQQQQPQERVIDDAYVHNATVHTSNILRKMTAEQRKNMLAALNSE